MKVGLVVSFKGSNYGMMLQALATQYYIDNLGYETEIISYKSGKSFGELFRKITIHFIPVVAKTSIRVKKRKSVIAKNRTLRASNEMRLKQGKNFVDAHLHDIREFHGYYELLRETKALYETVIIGSDQQWTPQCFYSPINTLEFVPDNINKASYATSMGVSSIPWYTRNRIKRYLSKLNYISVRERTGKDILCNILDRDDIVVMPDPTLLILPELWEQIIPKTVNESERYIFCYFLGNSDNCMKKVSELGKKSGFHIKAIRNIEIIDNNAYDYCGAEVLEAPTVEEFVNLIRNAEFVCTDSFHCTLFSILNNTPFASFYRMNSKDKNSRNSRIDDLLEGFGLADRVCSDSIDLCSIFEKKIDFSNVNRIIRQYQDRGAKYLQMVLEAPQKIS